MDGSDQCDRRPRRRTNDDAVKPPARLDVVQPGDDQLELSVEGFVPVLHLALVGGHHTTRHPLHYKVSRCLSLAFPDIAHAEQELTVEIADIDCVQICMDVEMETISQDNPHEPYQDKGWRTDDVNVCES